ncbi:MAG: 4'-phosphopantetheinyl transferase superfamily protein [Clostridiales bacterium]|nr:4'-phosphopantetheinyl transferase superfamily protein [Clostridiales bacterium]
MVYLYAMDTLGLSSDLADYRGMVPESRLYQLSVLTREGRLRSLAAELLFQRAVRRHCREVPLPVSRDVDEHGKPYLLGRPDFRFNLSHSGLWAVCAVAPVPVGVDIQQERPVSVKLSRKFTAAEQQSLQGLTSQAELRRIFDLWTMKEAYTKCIGLGLLCPFRSFEAEHPAPGYSTQLVDFPAGDYHLAICTQSEEPEAVQIIIMPS